MSRKNPVLDQPKFGRVSQREAAFRYFRAVRLPLGEIDHRLFRPAQVKGGAAAIHRLADGLHVGIGVLVEELEEETEVGRVAFVRRRCQEEQVVRGVAQ